MIRIWIPFGAVAILHLLLLLLDRERSAGVTKALLIPTLIPALFVAGAGRSVAPLVIVGLVLGWFGDIALLGRGTRSFLVGLALFLIGHLSYILWFGRHVDATVLIDLWWTIVPALAVLLGVGMLLWHRAGELRLPAIVYSLVLIVSVLTTAAAVRSGWDRGLLALAGASLFLVSDAILGIREFTPWIGRAQVAVMATYIPAQVCIGLSGIM